MAIKFLKIQTFSTLSALCLLSIGCGKVTTSLSNSSTGAGSASESVPLVVESMMGTISAATNDAEQMDHIALLEKQKFNFVQKAFAADQLCSLNRFSPSIGSGSNCSATTGGKTVTALFSNCTAGVNQEYKLNGTVKLEFDSATTCNSWVSGTMPNSGSITRTIPTDFKQFPIANENDITLLSTATLNNYKAIPYGGGIITTFQNDRKIITILGLHRVNADSFNHTIHTTVPLIISGSRSSNNRKIESGTVLVDHNVSKYTTTASMTNLQYVTNCCYPVYGTMDIELSSGSKTWDGQKHKVYFNTGTCGKIDIADNSGKITRHTLSACY